MQQRSRTYQSRPQGRYWWFHNGAHDYVPPVYAFLTDAEWQVLDDWYADTDENLPAAGECNVPAISLIQGLVMGSGIRHVVQLGHYQGYSSLLLGFMMRHMSFRQSVYSIDLSQTASDYTKGWLERAGLVGYVEVLTSDSAAPSAASAALEYFGSPPALVFVDSSHGYRHTLDELNLWYPVLQPGGLMLLHDVSQYAGTFDPHAEGGVPRALAEWLAHNNASTLALNAGVSTTVGGDRCIYGDPCGLGIIQKPF